MVAKDYLTSLFNRRYIDERLPADIVASVVHKVPLSVIFMDIDRFKYINDTYGHEAGDKVLKAVGLSIHECIRSGRDWAARYGGDEFLICLNNTGAEETQKIGERLTDHIQNQLVPVRNAAIRVSVSLGEQTMHSSSCTAEEIIRRADEKMYCEKHRKKEKAQN